MFGLFLQLFGYHFLNLAKTIELFGRKMMASVFVSPYRHVGYSCELSELHELVKHMAGKMARAFRRNRKNFGVSTISE